MIIDKPPLPDETTPADAPPAYESLDEKPRGSFTYPPDKEPTAGPSSHPPSLQPGGGSSSGSSSRLRKPPPQGLKGPVSPKGKSKWLFPFAQGQSRAAQEARITVQNLVRDVVKAPDVAGLSVLHDCAVACESHDLVFGDILQDRYIEGHCALYWAIVKRPREGGKSGKGEKDSDDEDHTCGDLVEAMLAMAAPLTDQTVSEIRLACLLGSDQALFQRLRYTPAFAPLSGTDEILLGGSIPQDDVSVHEGTGDAGEFVAVFRLVQFQKRMRISKQVAVEFIARGRMWCFKFIQSDGSFRTRHCEKGAWLVSLTLMEHSPLTWIDSRVLIDDVRAPRRIGHSASLSSSHLQPAKAWFERVASSSSVTVNDDKVKPTIELRLKTGSEQLASTRARSPGTTTELFLPLTKHPMGNSLQFDGCSYIAPDGSLAVRFEARLAKPENECIIC